jgi:4-diphosphocytidyl-2-C-methyl-D-erythritol kinase
MELFSPAKINLFLRIIRRREDGYHELASLFQTVNFGDTLRFKVRVK